MQPVAGARLFIGLAQGLVLYLLYRAGQSLAWPATQPLLFLPLLMTAVFVPLLAVNGLSLLPRRRLLQWLVLATLVVVALSFHDAWRMEGARLPTLKARAVDPRPQLSFALAAGLFIAHALLVAGSEQGRRIATYTAYFETAWKLGVQLAFSALFVGVTWLVLQLGAALFALVKLDFLRKAIQQAWFAIPVTTFAFACAMHLCDLRPAIVQGIRNLLLVLLSWILPVLVLLVGGFLASLPFTGLEPLWATRSAAAVLLGAAAAFVVLINAAWQNGQLPAARPVALAARGAALLLAPVVLLAIYALALRVADHGWTDERIVAAACMLVASCYAGGYAAAALRRGWLPGMAGVNIAAAFVVLGLLLALFTPIADPARLSVKDQVARFASGRVTAAQLDVGYLQFDGARYGRVALTRLEAQPGLLRDRIAAVRKLRDRHQVQNLGEAPSLFENVRVWPEGTRLPDSFMQTDWQVADHTPRVPDCLQRRGVRCDALLLDLNGDGRPEVLLFADQAWDSAFATEDARGGWRIAGNFASKLGCPGWQEAVRRGELRALPPAWAELELGGRRILVQPHIPPGPDCPGAPHELPTPGP